MLLSGVTVESFRWCGRRRLIAALFPLEAPLSRRPERFKISDDRLYFVRRKRLTECRHGQPLRLVERIAPAVPDDAVQHGIGMFPGMPFRTVRGRRQLALCVTFLPAGLAFCPGPVACGAVLLIDEAAGCDACLIRR